MNYYYTSNSPDIENGSRSLKEMKQSLYDYQYQCQIYDGHFENWQACYEQSIMNHEENITVLNEYTAQTTTQHRFFKMTMLSFVQLTTDLELEDQKNYCVQSVF